MKLVWPPGFDIPNNLNLTHKELDGAGISKFYEALYKEGKFYFNYEFPDGVKRKVTVRFFRGRVQFL